MKTFPDFDQLLQFNQEVLIKIIDEGEKKLDAQLVTANAADQRALSFSGFLIGASTAVVGAAIALTISKEPHPLLIVIAFLYAGCLLYATYLAVHSFRPKAFSFPGNLPENWFSDQWNFPVSRGRGPKKAMVEQCFTLNQAICKNQTEMDISALRLKQAIDIAVYATAVAALILAIFSLVMLWPDCIALNTSAPPAPAPPPPHP